MKNILIFCTTLLILIIITIINVYAKKDRINVNDKKLTNSNKILKENKNELRNYLPINSNYQWKYSGTDNLTYKLVLNNIKNNEENNYVFAISAIIENIDSRYNLIMKITEDKIIYDKKDYQEKESEHFTLLKLPLNCGNKWVEETIDIDGNSKVTYSTITKITTFNNKKMITVRYESKNEEYFEERDIKEDYGIISYRKIEKKSNKIISEYSLEIESSGYLNELELKKYIPEYNKTYLYTNNTTFLCEGKYSLINKTQLIEEYCYQGEFLNLKTNKGKKVKIKYIADFENGYIKEINNEMFTNIKSPVENLITLKLPLEQGQKWVQKTNVNGKSFDIVSCIDKIDLKNNSISTSYSIEGNVAGYLNNIYFEKRQYKVNEGLIDFEKLKSLEKLDKDDIDEDSIDNLFEGYKKVDSISMINKYIEFSSKF